jgi:hypothetical protein
MSDCRQPEVSEEEFAIASAAVIVEDFETVERKRQPGLWKKGESMNNTCAKFKTGIFQK